MVFIVQTDISVGRELILFTKSTYFTYRSCGQDRYLKDLKLV